jgi:hypothetical protein
MVESVDEESTSNIVSKQSLGPGFYIPWSKVQEAPSIESLFDGNPNPSKGNDDSIEPRVAE